MTPLPSVLVFSDLDGTLLDHDNYSWAAARPALDLIHQTSGGLVLASSKTAAEIYPLRAAMGFDGWPAITENGSGVLAAHQTPSEVNGDYATLRKIMAEMPTHLRRRCRGFGDMTTADVAQITGLRRAEADRAKKRGFSEPCQWHGTTAEREELDSFLAVHGVSAQQGGRFLTLSFGRTKASAMAGIIAELKPSRTIALGDAPNDIEMLQAADIGVIVANPSHTPLPRQQAEDSGRIIRTITPGPQGWNDAIHTLLQPSD